VSVSGVTLVNATLTVTTASPSSGRTSYTAVEVTTMPLAAVASDGATH
jgi:hypothetical protein